MNEISKRFRLISKQKKTEKRDFWFWPGEKWNEEPKNERGGRGRGRGRGRKETLADKPLDFWKAVFASERSAWLARLVEQYWHVSIKGLFHTERSCMVRDTHLPVVIVVWFWLARFTLQCKSIFFNFFWNTKLFLRLYKGTGIRSFNLFCKVAPGSE